MLLSRKQCLKSSRVSTRHASKFSFSCSKKEPLAPFLLALRANYSPLTLRSSAGSPGACTRSSTHTRSVHFLCLMVPGCTRQEPALQALYEYRRKKPKLLIYKAFRVDTYHVLIGIPIIACDRYLIAQLSKLSLNLLTSQIFLLSFVIVELSALICIPVKFELSTAQITNQRRKKWL